MVFLDGVGIGPDEPDRNPFLRARLPVLREILGGRLPTLAGSLPASNRAVAYALDATLGLAGTPQSGTGQTSLLTGRNAAELFGRHFGPWTPVKLRPVLAEHNLLSRARGRGLSAAFANAYPEGWHDSRHSRFPAAPPLAARAAGLLTRHADELARGEAVASGITNTAWREHLGHQHVPEIDPEAAGRNLGRIATTHRLTLYAHYATDHAGHRGEMSDAVEALERVDRFLGGVLEELPSGAALLTASDHGNIEDVRGGHTRNPALGLWAGPEPPELGSILQVAGAVLDWLGEGRGPLPDEVVPDRHGRAPGAPPD